MTITLTYFKGQADVLDSKFRGSQTSHSGDTGDNREEILSDWLSSHVPGSITPQIGGQVIDFTGNITKQVDIVLYNDSAPKFGGNPKSYFFADGVTAAIEVKSSLSSNTLASAIDNLETVKKCRLQKAFAFIVGKPRENILTGIFAFELDNNDFKSVHGLIESLKRRESEGKSPVDFICINKTTYIAHNKGEWQTLTDEGEKTTAPNGYFVVDSTHECIFRMILSLSIEAKKNIASAVDYQSYFIKGWERS